MNKSDNPLTKNTAADDGTIIASIENDNLQIIEGIGPAMEKVLHENGITTWKELGQHSTAKVKRILDKYGDKYNVINPASWIDQAKMAAKGDAAGIIQKQKDDGSISKLEKLLKSSTILKKQPPAKKQASTKKTTKKPVSRAKSTVAKAKVAIRKAPVKQGTTKKKPGKKATTKKKVVKKYLATKPLPKKKASTKKQLKLHAVTTDTLLDQTIDLNSPHLPIHPERIWPD